MGLPMDDIHNPSVPSGPTTNGNSNGAELEKLSLFELQDQKKKVEEELSALSSVLDSHGVNMNTPLTTFDGYPRDDIDVAQIRTTRARIIRLKNDHKALLSKMEQALHEYHAEHRSTLSTASSNRNNPTATPSPSSGSTNATDTTLTETPFAKINTVAPGSPAEEAGLKPGDRVRRFGDVNWMNHENLRRVANVVQRHQGRRVEVKVVRDINDGMGQSRELSLGLIPRVNWGGRGSLGCHLLPI